MEHASYLKHLVFDNKLASSIQAKYLSNPRLLVLLLTIIITLGVYSYLNIPRRLNPEIKIPIVVVSTVLPGASPTDVESLVTKPIEDSLGGVQNIKTFTSSSRDSVSIVQIEFNSGIDGEKATSDVKTAVDSVSLPDDSQDPNVAKVDFEQVPVWSFSLTSTNGDTASLITFSRELKDRLEGVKSIDQVSVTGLEEQEIQILIKPEAISTYGFNPSQILSTLPSSLKAFPAGNLRTENFSYTLSVDPTVGSIDDIRSTKINLGTEVVNLSDIATISERSKPSQPQSFVSKENETAHQSVSFAIYKSENANINDSVHDAEKITEAALKNYEGQFNIFTTSNVSEEIDHQFNELIRDFILTVVLVFAAMLIFLGVRQAIVASLSIPITFLISFIAMNVFGISLSFISFFSLLLVLGLLVDDTIVVVSAVTSYYRSGKFTPFQTGLLVWRDFIVAIFTTTLTTVWAFVPLLLSSGIIGEFIKPIPIVVSTTLIASFFVAMFITLPIITYLLRPSLPRRVKNLILALIVIGVSGFIFAVSGRGPLLVLEFIVFAVILFLLYKLRNKTWEKFNSNLVEPTKKYHDYFDNGLISLENLSIRYQLFIQKILLSKSKRRLVIAVVVIFSIFSYLLVPLGFVKNEFFPKTDANQILITVELPPGTNLPTSKNEALSIFRQLQDTQDLETISLDLGTGVGDFGGGQASGVNNFLYTLVLKEDREASSFDIAEDIREEFKDYTTGKFSVVEQSGGPPAGADVQIKLIGPDLGVLDNYADEIEKHLESQPGITNVNKSIKPGTSKITFVPDKQMIASSGVSGDQIGFALRTFASGLEIASSNFGEESMDEQDITLRLSSDTQFTENINTLNVTSMTGEQIPLNSLGVLKLETSPTLVTREDGDRTISVTASVRKGYAIADANKEVEQFADELDLPVGYSWKTGGVNEENEASVNSILIAMVLSFILILGTMVLQFSSFRKAIIVLLVIPISISGVFIIFALTNTPLSFPALIGVLALFGIVVKNSILIVDKIQTNEKTSMEFSESIAEGSASRLEPIALTSLTAILGLIPITLSDPLWRGLGGAIISGLTFSGTIMLFFIPVVYYLTFRPNQKETKVSPAKK